MGVKPHSWWQQIKQHWVFANVVGGILVVIIALIIVGLLFGWDWTAFTSVTGPILKPNEQYRPAKTLWDWLQLLIVPVVLAVLGYYFTRTNSNSQDRTARIRADQDRDTTINNQRETELQNYFDKISEFIDSKTANQPQPGGTDAVILRARTLSVLAQFDPVRKRRVIQFLSEANLIGSAFREEAIISLVGADLKNADLSRLALWGVQLGGTDLSGANLMGAELSPRDTTKFAYFRASIFEPRQDPVDHAHTAQPVTIHASLSRAVLHEANLSNACLRYVDLREADLSNATLEGADLTQANLTGAEGITIEGLEKQAKSLEGATMPDGSTHP